MNGYVMYNYAYVFLPNVTLEFLLAILVERRSAGDFWKFSVVVLYFFLSFSVVVV